MSLGIVVVELIRLVLSWGDIVPEGVSPIGGSGNRHWRVRRGRDGFVLRMYRRGQSDLSIRYELNVLTRLRSRGWPVAAAVGDTVLHSGFVFALFPLLPGSPHEGGTAGQRRG